MIQKPQKSPELSSHHNNHRSFGTALSSLQSMKQQLIDIRIRKNAIPKVPNPKIVDNFKELHDIKSSQQKKNQMLIDIQFKKKQYVKLKKQYDQQKQKYDTMREAINQRSLLTKILTSKLETQYQKTKQKYKQIQFNQNIIIAIKKVTYYRLAQIIFNEASRNIFATLQTKNQNKTVNKSDEQLGVCLGYIGLVIAIVGQLSGARLWINFNFKGSKSTVKLNDGTIATLHPRDKRFGQAVKLLSQQLYQIMKYKLGINVEVSETGNLYHLSETLSTFLMS